VVDWVVIVVFCVVVFGLLKHANFLKFIFGVFPFWELAMRRRHTPGAKAPHFLTSMGGPRLKPWLT
jgi:hypothetical protein